MRVKVMGISAACVAAMLLTTAPAVAQPTCGPGPDWIDGCTTGGTDNFGLTGAIVALDQNGDPLCQRDISLVLSGPVTVVRGGAYMYGYRCIELWDIDTEITSAVLQDVGATVFVRIGAGAGAGPNGALLQATYGTISETVQNNSLGESFFDVYFEIDFGGGDYGYNHDPLRIEEIIDRVPPLARYLTPITCLDLYDHPTGGNLLIQRLTTAWHSTLPGDEFLQEGACCYSDQFGHSWECVEGVPEFDCYADGGVWKGLGALCEVAPTEACCFPDGTCVDDMDQECCVALGGWVVPVCLGDAKGNGKDDACEPLQAGACCEYDGTCSIRTEIECLTLPGASYNGDFTNCHGNTNGNSIDDACEHQIPAFSTYGIVILALLLVAAAVIVMRQRRVPQA